MGEFDFQAKFPISEYVNGVINKRKMEMEDQENNRQALLTGLSTFGKLAADYKSKKDLDARAMSQATLLGNQNPELLNAFGMNDAVATRPGKVQAPLPQGQQGPLNEVMGQVPIERSHVQGGREGTVSALANAIKGLTGEQLLNHLKPDTVDETVYLKDAKGNITGTQSRKVPKGSKTLVIGPQPVPGQSSGLQQSQYADQDGTPLNFNKANGQYLRPDGRPAINPVLRKGDESSVNDATLIANQLPQIDVLFDSYKAKGKLGKAAQATPLGYALDPATKQAENSLKLAAFTFGGKNLTGQEKEVVFGALFPNAFDNDQSRENKRVLLKNFFNGKIDLLEAANQLGPSAKPLREMLLKIQKESDKRNGGGSGDISSMSDEELQRLAAQK